MFFLEDIRYLVTIRCFQCGEKFILRGKRTEKGQYETGFKRCVCGNESSLHIDATPEK
ncbi:hypothetical protein AJ85_09525 [Alkalihalobacillus alcalophilus ATCC 27647 = CGMCC 1.3604]|uniref:Uncharacterized protein n=1 Tax=Alkalihalobacillus alcalophilus ATCC 27647 = CGMCC 1.3604 TaxID=1218173 RepID=A0A4S4JZC3_ALKAL|nr:hypothetical protein [Alkalihalobacillus alcalophilus]MED1562495.1 hypothetical protein [Alkalihalobacillus alcalophilus]THG90643.1 hypothetical protein AJ85_09525 [Alkalihalobacillus alcalophilus ATCC 27647 = CGMCC 1.3604]